MAVTTLMTNRSLVFPTTSSLWQIGANVNVEFNETMATNGTSPSLGTLLQMTSLGTLLASLCLLTLVGNAFVLHAVRTERRLQTVSNMFIVSLAIADLIVGATVMPISAIYIFSERWIFGLELCQFWLAIDYIASTASILNLFILSLDRYWSVTSPLQYIRRRTRRRAMVMISVAWFVASLWLVPILSWHHLVHGGERTVSADECDTEYATNTLLKIITAIFNFYLPLTVMYGIYTKIFLEIRKRSKFEVGMRISGSMLRAESCAFGSLSEESAELHPHVNHAPSTGPLCVCHEPHDETDENHRCRDADESHYTVNSVISTDHRLNESSQSTVAHNSDIEYKQHRWNTYTRCTSTDERPEHLPLNGMSRKPVSNNILKSSAALTRSFSQGSRPAFASTMTRCASEIPSEFSGSHDSPAFRSRHGSAIWRRAARWRLRAQRYKHTQSSSLSREIKAAKQLGVIMGAFTLCFFPYFICFMVVAFCVGCVDKNLMTAMTWIGYLNSTMNPFLYPLCNVTFRHKFREMLNLQKKETKHYQNSQYMPPRPSPVTVRPSPVRH